MRCLPSGRIVDRTAELQRSGYPAPEAPGEVWKKKEDEEEELCLLKDNSDTIYLNYS